jgi:Kef-type K+ transport system membrane component KefB
LNTESGKLDSPAQTSGRARTLLFYTAMLAAAVVVFMAIRHFGEQLPAPTNATSPNAQGLASQSNVNTLLHVLLALATVIVTARALGALFSWIQQPAVIGEVIGGILLGPSLLGRVAPDVATYLLPPSVAPFLSIIAQLGVILYMFLVGLELDLGIIARSGHVTIAISHASIVVPFTLGGLLALWLYPTMAPQGVEFTTFALFIGVSMSITAFPVLARILTDRKLAKTRLGTIALTCAAADDATAWCLLALVVSIAQAQIGDALSTVALTIVFVLAIVLVVAPAMRRLVPLLEKSTELSRTSIAVILVAMLLSAMATEFIGIHAIFGAFLLGAAIPHQSQTATELTRRLEDVVSVLFLPAFFAFTGMRTQIGLISGWDNWLLCFVILVVACAGKFGGALAAARFTGLGWRDSSAIGILMNTRGLVELIVLNIGLDLGILSPTLFAMLVIMALVTTFMTTPILHSILRRHPWVEEHANGDAKLPAT